MIEVFVIAVVEKDAWEEKAPPFNWSQPIYEY
jgi:hypothetical protein